MDDSLSVQLLFFDENTWLRSNYLKTIAQLFQSDGKVLNLELPKQLCRGLSDRQIFNILLTYASKNRVWLFTRDKTMYQHIPHAYREQVLVINDITALPRFTAQIKTCLIVLIVLAYENSHARKLQKRIISIIKRYIEDVLTDLTNEYIAEGFP